MDKKHIIVSETQRPFWKLPIAALIFTAVIYIIGKDLYYFNWSNDYFRYLADEIKILPFLIAVGIYLSSHKKVYIDIENSKFKPTIEIGFIKIGAWKTINEYEYISIFFNPSKNESEAFEVNLWYNKNKHFELYTRNNFEDALVVAYEISEQLNIDLLDATIKGDNKWIDKENL